MKHLLILLVLAACLYAAWNMADKKELQTGLRFVTRHGLRLGFLVLVILGLLAAAVYLPSLPLLQP